ncbi:MAG: hypothetical protein PHI97_01120 [Desulfobulbus sp.]|nr:hypothetical protein [Desulfobulbus sp.]
MPVIAVCDVNTIWRHRPFSAMAELTDVLAFAPGDLRAVRQRSACPETALPVVEVLLPPGWASKTAVLGQRLLWRRMRAEAKRCGKLIDCVVVTSPHYLTLLRLLPPNIKTIYYASDDYRSYSGWKNMAQLEAEMVRRVDHSFFISEGLAQRAIGEYGVAAEKVSVSMNATEPRFFPTPEALLPVVPPCGSLPRPIAGVVGGINDRLDFDLLLACADLSDLGTLLLVGPLPKTRSVSLQRLLMHPKCRSVGAQPHDTLHRWFQCLDVGLIPYVKNKLNLFCSPMRLFDHMATGGSIIATDACEQVNLFADYLSICHSNDNFIKNMHKQLQGIERKNKYFHILWKDRAEIMMNIIVD